ncbi:uncharacterized protein LOC123563585 isoform X3 [Mercenaria mercenaria]|uniref:uncharacterized protein LOC123563585 isoform X3 n=1 Tax=Mercenaria mercenaria TaxID=6596 RepID=UPI00234E4A9A|nr:uncharacterized protein LOC123563585 isoform X3 [Mercenaria mercenaria]
MGGKLTEKDMDQLEQWIGTGPKTFTLLYAITTDGCNATTFHQKCDNQGATVTVLYNPQGSVYGGYAPVSWTSSGTWINNNAAFLYQLRFNGNNKATKFTIKPANSQYTLHDGQNYGPLFGGGNDLRTFEGTVNSSGTYFTLNGYMNLGHTYDNQGITKDQINNGNMNVTELEVYKVADGKRQKTVEKECSKPWRKTRDWNEQYTPYKVKVKSGAPLNFRLCDTRGLEESQGLDVLECNYLLDGNIPNYYQFNPTTLISPKTPGFKASPTTNDVIHCAVFVLDATTLEVLSTKIIEKMKGFQNLMNQKGIPQIILLTKIDKLCNNVEKDVSLVFKSPEVEQHVEKASQLLGLPRANVLPVKNYENENELDDNISILALLALRQILYFAEDFLDHMLDKKNDEQSEMEKLKLEN